MFCIRCGREAVPGTVFCSDCISSGETLSSMPGSLTFEICPSCGKMKRGSSWAEVRDPDRVMKGEIRKAVTLGGGAILMTLETDGLNPSENSSNVRVSLTLSTHGVRKEEEHTLVVRVEGNTCPTCNRRSGQYFESTIQLRASGSVREEVMDRVLAYASRLCADYEKSEKGFFVSGIRQTRGGVDIALSSNMIGASIAKKIAQRFGSSVLPTRKLYGRRNGKEVYRTTFLIRLAMFKPGDYVQYRGSYHSVTGTGEFIALSPLGGGEELRVRPSDSTSVRLVGGRELEDWAEVVELRGERMAVRNERTMEVREMPLQAGADRGSRIRVVTLNDELLAAAPR